jgi:signal transduction histidine kinase
LRPSILDDFGIIAAIEWQVEEFQKRAEINCAVTIDIQETILDKKQSTAIFRIVQESITNISRHARATKAKLTMKNINNELALEVRDNGIGITDKQVDNLKALGLIGMRERAYALGGELKISGVKGKGTTVSVSIPIGKKRKGVGL